MSKETKRTSEREAGLEGEARKGEAVEGEGAKAGEAVAVERESTDGGAEGEGAKAGEAVAAKPEKKPGRLQLLLQEYGAVAFVVWFTLFGLTLCGFVLAISAGFETDGTGESAGVWAIAYGLTQATKPIRIALTVVLTPLAATLWHRVRGKPLPPKKG